MARPEMGQPQGWGGLFGGKVMGKTGQDTPGPGTRLKHGHLLVAETVAGPAQGGPKGSTHEGERMGQDLQRWGLGQVAPLSSLRGHMGVSEYENPSRGLE